MEETVILARENDATQISPKGAHSAYPIPRLRRCVKPCKKPAGACVSMTSCAPGAAGSLQAVKPAPTAPTSPGSKGSAAHASAFCWANRDRNRNRRGYPWALGLRPQSSQELQGLQDEAFGKS